ncbi:MAG TPA: acyltransferase [Acidobacteriaceae bacterium]
MKTALATAPGEAALRPQVEAPRFYRPELDALRFFAFLAVFLHHGIYTFAPLLSVLGGFGLSFFFFLSAFLITELLQRERELTGTIGIRDFYVRRVLRIWPLYFGFLLFAWVLGTVFPSHHISLLFVLSYVLMLGNLYTARYGLPYTPVGYLWSISIEEQFYLLWPLLNRVLPRRALIVAVAALVPVGAAAVLLLARAGQTPAQGIWDNSLVEFQIFALGALTALGLRGRIPHFGPGLRLVLLGAGSALWLGAARFSGIDDRMPRGGFGPMLGYWAVGLGCACLLVSALGIGRQAIPRPLVYLGKISYGLYVFHQISLEVVSHLLNHTALLNSAAHHAAYGIGHVGLGLLLTGALAALSYRFYEKPFLRWKDAFTVVRSRAA